MKIFIDTSAFVALLVENEQFHQKIVEKYKSYRQQRATFFTSYYILDELYTRLLYFNVSNIKQHIQAIQHSISENEITAMQVSEALFEKSLTVFLKYSDHKVSFTDATTFVLYKDFNLDEVFTLDSDFKKMRINTAF